MTREEKINILKSRKEEAEIDGYFGFATALDSAIKALEQESNIYKIRAEITDCLKALDEIEKSGLNIYLPNEMSGRRLTYQQCLEFIDKHKADRSEEE